MASKTVICNLGLSYLGITKLIRNIDTERSEEARIMSLLYETHLRAHFRRFPHPFSTKIQALALVAQDPNEEWAYAYRYPSDCEFFRRIQSGSRNDTQNTKVPYRIASDAQGRLIFTDQENAIGEWTMFVSDSSLYPADFVNSFALRLATYAAPSLTAGDPFKLGERAMKLFMFENSISETSAENEGQSDQPPESEYINARN